jgi:S-formylglutathione hydrolase
MELISTHRCFNGEQRRYRMHAETLHSDTTVSVYLPPASLSTASKGHCTARPDLALGSHLQR